MKPNVAVILPCYRVRPHILKVISEIAEEDVWRIYVIDDCCPDGTGSFVDQRCNDPRVRVLRNEHNQGVGGAVIAGYKQAIADGAEVIVKIDGDGQMDPALIPYFTAPILSGGADYCKGNRFYDLSNISAMPKIRIFGNAVLSLMTKLSSGYWDLFDPTNGYTAIHSDLAKHLPFEKISSRYFFESDMLFQLNTLRAVVVDIPMDAKYADEVSGLKISRIIGEFFFKHIRNFLKRIFYNYYLRDLSLASLELPLGIFLLAFGGAFGVYNWVVAAKMDMVSSSGTVMISALPILMGLQFLLAFFAYDIAQIPRRAVHGVLRGRPISARESNNEK
jgi:glycosyltransferase involved in cell wall biosynthesis